MISHEEIVPRLQELHRKIDDAYSEIARTINFSCHGCDGVKCCTVDLSLHTHVEMLYLRKGLDELAPDTRREIVARSKAIVEVKRIDQRGDGYRNSVCALNSSGMCILYHHRPLICRLAGIPHKITRPDGKLITSGGCTKYTEQIEDHHPGVLLDRTAFYRGIAELEIDIIKQSGCRAVSRTIAEVLAEEEDLACLED